MADWGKIGGIAGVVGAVAAVVALIPPLLSTAVPPAGGDAALTAPSAWTPSAQAGWQPVPTTDNTTTPATICRAEDGQPAPCTDSGAGLVSAVDRCTPEDALRTLGIEPGLRQLDVRAEVVDGHCLLLPGAVAERAGASAEHIRGLPASEPATILSLCYASASGPEVACSAPHTIEYVGPWLDQTQGSADQVCDAAARRYTNRTFDSPTEELAVVMLTAPGKYRCAVAAPEPLTSSLWQRGGAAIR